MTLLENKNNKIKRTDFPTQARDVFDVLGAGDTVIASVASGLAADFTLEESIRLANIAAGIVVGKFGTASVYLDEIRPYYEKRISTKSGRCSSFRRAFSRKQTKKSYSRMDVSIYCMPDM